LFDLSRKTALITGASGGFGERFARCLSKAGAYVILAARSLNKIQNLADELEKASVIEMDVSDKNSVNNAFDQLENSNQRIDICINNAGITTTNFIFETNENDDFEKTIQTNLIGTWYVTKAVANHMKNKGISGSIINVGSINGDAVPAFGTAGYNVSKAGIIYLTKSLVGELSPYNIRINSISPGTFPTKMTEWILKDDEIKKKIIKRIPLGFMPNLKDLDGVILFLASNKASRYVTGQTITIDGGNSWGGIEI
jgi:NAD(P)-dependent dehydrogenase (short-subunit alcohol dehydrogenase family)